MAKSTRDPYGNNSTPQLGSGPKLFDGRNPLSQSAPATLEKTTENKIDLLLEELRKLCGKILKHLNNPERPTLRLDGAITISELWAKPLKDAIDLMSAAQFMQFATEWKLVYPLEIEAVDASGKSFTCLPDESFLEFTPDPPSTDECLALLKENVMHLLCLVYIRDKFPFYRFESHEYSSARFLEALKASSQPYEDIIALDAKLEKHFRPVFRGR